MYTSPTGRNTPLVTGVKSYIEIPSTGRNYAVSYWRKIQLAELEAGPVRNKFILLVYTPVGKILPT